MKQTAQTFCGICEEYYEITIEVDEEEKQHPAFYIKGLHIHTMSQDDKVELPTVSVLLTGPTGLDDFARMLREIQPLPF